MRSSFHCNIKLLHTENLMHLTYIASMYLHHTRIRSRVAVCRGGQVCLADVFCWLTFEAELVLVPANVEETGHVLWRQEDDEELQKAFQGQSADFDVWFGSVCCF